MDSANPGDGNQESVGQPASLAVNMSTTGTQRSPAKRALTEVHIMPCRCTHKKDDFVGGPYILRKHMYFSS